MNEHHIRTMLGHAGRRLLASRALLGLGQWLMPPLAALLFLCLIDNALHLPEALRLVCALGVLAAVVHGLRVHLWRQLRGNSPERTAVLIEQAAGITDNTLISACQFEGLAEAGVLRGVDMHFVRQSLVVGAKDLEKIPWEKLLRVRATVWWLVLLAASIGVWCAYASLMPDHARNGLIRLVMPWVDQPALGNVQLQLEPGHDLSVYEGDSLEITVAVRQLERSPVNSGSKDATDQQPLVVTQHGTQRIAESLDAGDHLAMAAVSGHPGVFATVCGDLHHSFVFRVWCAGSWTRAIAVTVLPTPVLRSARFLVHPPAYAGTSVSERPGPPATLTVLQGSSAQVEITLDRQVRGLLWRSGTSSIALDERQGVWSTTIPISNPSRYALCIQAGDGQPERTIAQGSIQLDVDHPPQVEILASERNRFVNPGEHVLIRIKASDDNGVAETAVLAHEASDPSPDRAWQIHAWKYLGPPGNPGPLQEQVTLTIDPARFAPGNAYVIEATARDFAPPAGQLARSQPVVLRVRALEDLSLAEGDGLEIAFQLLRKAIAAEQHARSVTSNVLLNLEGVRKNHALDHEGHAIAEQQEQARASLKRAHAAFLLAKDDSSLVVVNPIIDHVMPDVATESGALTQAGDPAAALAHIEVRQDDIIQRLITLLGELAERSRQASQAPKPTPANTAVDSQREKLDKAARDLKDDLDRFIKDQNRIIERSKTLAEHGPADLTSSQEAILGELTKEESAWAKFLEEKLTDFSKLPGQDFADARQAEALAAVWQNIKAAAKALDQKNAEVAVPGEQAGLELAQKIENNLERWMAEAADSTKWSMEEPKSQADVPLAELPKQLEDIIGDLLDKEKDMTEDVQDVSSSWMDSADKGAGWGSGDGPISNMSAKGITGNALPNNNEVAGRSGEGRNGRSNGQMVEDTAKGKGGQETPTRLSPSPFEQGTVKDEDKKGNGGATGGGKNAGFASEGLQGPTPPPQMQQAMARLAGKQAQLKQKASAVALALRAQHLPSGDLENAVQAMTALESAERGWQGGQIKARYSAALDSLAQAKDSVHDQKLLQRERSKLPDQIRQQAMSSSGQNIPPGYEDMVGRYFQDLAGTQTDEVAK